MLFPTVSFAVFFAIVLTVSWLLMPHRTWWKLFLTGASWFFYGCAGWGFVLLLAASTVFNHFMAFNVDRTEGRARRWWTGAAVAPESTPSTPSSRALPPNVAPMLSLLF